MPGRRRGQTTSRKKPPIPRGRRRPDPLAKVTDDLKAWFDEDPSQTGRELLCRLQAAHPDDYPDDVDPHRAASCENLDSETWPEPWCSA